ncbi:hypothetical protein DEU56DRAFT_787564 [Suillus clintonianus]|uniref:uncharacterized protein n=1 Tax=Suillus clintonianus TaxID=1904413 RepID=UPI001B8850C1|nr:uncharacterized protein DEU56DRAFT_787564 [Suillus clintonianus]KAG2146339.1 hypothetical protein DEU56DRAFT_787564 [Suillus clintonianus]
MVIGNLKRTREDQDPDDGQHEHRTHARRCFLTSFQLFSEQIPTHRNKILRHNDRPSASVAIDSAVEKDTKSDDVEIVDSRPHTLRPAPLGGTHGNTINSLLDLTSLCSQDNISARFDSISSALLSEYYLSVIHGGSQTDYEILELEFYFQKTACHEDPFTHGSAEQERSGQWYFHRAPKRSNTSQANLAATVAGGYRGGTRKGLDLTFGASSSMEPHITSAILRGGALLRTIRRYHDQKVISGPSLLVDEILRVCSASNINELVSAKWQGDISALSAPSQPRSIYMYLRERPASSLATSPVFRSPRIGLDLSNPETKASPTHPRVIFVGKLYRYFTYPELLVTNGRTQTFVGLYLALVEGKKYEPGSLEFRNELNKLTGIKDTTLAKYFSDYQLGYEKGKLANFVGAHGKGVLASASAYLRMMGTLAMVLHEAP